MDRKQHRTMRVVAAAALALGVAGGSYGIAGAASGSGSGSSSGALTVTTAQQAAQPQGWGQQRSDETLLTGDTESKVRAAAVARVSDATVSRVETDADGHAAYEVHMVRSDGTLVTVYVDKQFDVVSVETGMPSGMPAAQPTA
jgi:hypothetical protein